jgi:site-specific recombinase
MELFLRLPHDEKRAKWDSLSAEQQVELGALTRLITCNNLDATEWHFRVEDEWQRTLPVLRQAIASEKSDPVVVVLAELLAHISYAKHDLRGDSELLERLERRIRRIKDPTAKWYAGEYLDWIREHRASFAPPIDP